MLKVDMAKCFDRIDHQALLANLPAPPGIRRQVRAWLRSGIMEDDVCSPTTAGTPQGGSVSPLLALIALHGMDTAITQVYPEARVIAYADDCMVLHEDRSVLEHCQHLFTTWLAEIGLTLNVAKTHIHHTLEGDQPGMDFLGVPHSSISGGNPPIRERTPTPPAARVQNADHTRQGQRQGASGRARADHSQQSGLAPSGLDPSTQPQDPRLGQLLSDLG